MSCFDQFIPGCLKTVSVKPKIHEIRWQLAWTAKVIWIQNRREKVKRQQVTQGQQTIKSRVCLRVCDCHLVSWCILICIITGLTFPTAESHIHKRWRFAQKHLENKHMSLLYKHQSLNQFFLIINKTQNVSIDRQLDVIWFASANFLKSICGCSALSLPPS